MTTNFKVIPSDVLGFSYRNFISSQKAKAIGSPKIYYDERNVLMDAVKNQIITSTYNTLFELLTKGTNPKDISASLTIVPNYPPQKCNDVLIDICSNLADSLEEIVDLIYPADFEKIADSRLLIKTKGESVSV